MSDIRAPFTLEQVERLNQWQFSGSFHPYTCGGERTDELHLDGEGVLMATTEGWQCPYCNYTQPSASAHMVEEPSPPREGSMADNLWGETARRDPAQPERLLAAFRAEKGHLLSGRFRGLILSIIAHARLPQALPLLVEQLHAADPWLRYWAVKGLELLGTFEARTALHESRPTESVRPDVTIQVEPEDDQGRTMLL
jgi:hypothetical protein